MTNRRPGSTREWRNTRLLILARDNWTCTARITCTGAPLHPQCTPRGCDTCAHVDHHPTRWADGGTDTPDNLRAACRRCNLTQQSDHQPSRNW